ncbi:MAG: VWA domain-containing protein [SAR324 cluster bacterium]|uniref:VWA domain-containing protein n=1 Tax=SAR324 cluster bacterium TaxID=2024889 RepID=A0A7X9IJC1_9DELT|nr:VWA domain-containing protein [SAR324 cluster bacterium]
MDNSSLTFAYPWYLLIGLFVVVGATLFFAKLKKRNYQALETFANHRLIPELLQGYSRYRRILKSVLLISAVVFIFSAMARPQKGFQWQEITRKGIDILFALDTSKSMLATDVNPNRLERSKLALIDFISKLEGDRVGLIAFSGTAFLMLPLTLDYNAFLEALHTIDTNLIPKPGTNVASAIDEAILALKNSPNQKILVLISDGEDLEGASLRAAKAAADVNLKIFTIGVGSHEGELIPLKNQAGGSSFLKNQDGNPVKSRLDEETLTEIARISKGAYFPLEQTGEGLERVYSEKLRLLPKQELSQRMKQIPIERFEWCLLAALVLLMAEYGIKERPSKHAHSFVLTRFFPKIFGAETKKQSGLLKALFWCSILISLTACSKSPEELYSQGLYAEASKALQKLLDEDPKNPALHYNFGTSLYKEGKYEEAEEELRKALEDSDLQLQERAYYNSGNALYRKGEKYLGNDKQKTITSWNEALANYQKTLKLNNKNEDAKFNHDLVERKLKELLAQQEQENEKKGADQNQEESNDQQKQSQDRQNKEAPQHEKNQDQASKNDENSKDKTSESSRSELREQNTKVSEPSPIPTLGTSSSMERYRADENEMSKEEAEALLQALRNEEKKNLIQPKELQNTEEDIVERNW